MVTLMSVESQYGDLPTYYTASTIAKYCVR